MKKILLLIIFTVIFKMMPAQLTDTAFVQIGNVNIFSILTKPENAGNTPLTVIIAGSGPTDLNGNQPNLINNSLLYLSDSLVANNIATLRFDKRGIARSSYPGFKESDLKIEVFADDVIALIHHFEQKGFHDIYIIGHSEGSLIGMIAAQNIKINGFISLCGAGNPADVILEKQLKPKLPPAFYDQVVQMIDSLKNGQLVHNVPPQLNALFRPSVQPYLISWFKYNPAALIKNLTCPVLIIEGDRDLQVDTAEAEILYKASVYGRLVIIKGMNHVLKIVSDNMQDNIAAYTNADLPVSEDLVRSMVEFIRETQNSKP